ncbi:hypothetical protein EKI60_01970 [Candidatus Saccharibacteria bacterium]|nr:MAG: hypothetical protein EKI60_01970 [Candidatus Saccharibacteria bacterium]
MILPHITDYLNTFAAAGSCKPSGGAFLGFPTWYKYLDGVEVVSGTATECVIKINHINDAWLILAAVIELLLRLGALVAIGIVIAGGVQYITSEGQPDKLSKALKMIINAAIGLALTVASAGIVSFVAGRFN